MEETTIDRETMGRLASALAFIGSPDDPVVLALRKAAETGTDKDVKAARAPLSETEAGRPPLRPRHPHRLSGYSIVSSAPTPQIVARGSQPSTPPVSISHQASRQALSSPTTPGSAIARTTA